VALMLKKRGIRRVRPLAGGLESWLHSGYPVVSLADEGVGEPG
jgi:rhodanese-related sulfurtransferase